MPSTTQPLITVAPLMRPTGKLSKPSHMPGVLPGPRPLSAIDRKYLGIRRALVQLDFERVRVHLDKPCQRVPILLGRRTHANCEDPRC
ncbi:hypothetical protein EDD95_8161 [Streptomyces sp. CEV 2-1]|nr:hypothetical protein EDD95_8161 [Streptomyces sp. CEV 2-1]